MQKVKISFEELDQYTKYAKSNSKIKVSLNEFVKKIKDIKDEVQADLTEIDFKENFLDLSNLDLSATILPYECSGQRLFIEGADLTGCDLSNTKFTQYISLANVKLGSISLDKKIFSLCRLKGANYHPYHDDIVRVAVTDGQIKDFLASKEKNLNNYLSNLLKDKYPKDSIITADLKGRIIDKTFSNKDLSNSVIENCVFTGEIENLVLRDCITDNTLFSDCIIHNPDLRGTSFAVNDSSFKSVIFSGHTKIINPIMSLGTNDPNCLSGSGLLDFKREIVGFQAFDSVDIQNIKIDPCYFKSLASVTVPRLVSCTRADLMNYADYCKNSDANHIVKNFHEWKGISAEDVADFSFEDLSNINGLSNCTKSPDLSAKFYNCNFAFADLSKTNLDSATFKKCNFAKASFTNELNGYQKISNWVTKLYNRDAKTSTSLSLNSASFIDCVLDGAIMHNVSLENARFQNVSAINLEAQGLKLDSIKAFNSNFKGSNLDYIVAEEVDIKRGKWDYTSFQYGNFSGKLAQNSFNNANGRNVRFKSLIIERSDLDGADFGRASFEDVNINEAKFGANIERARMLGCSLKDADLSGLLGALQNVKNVDFSAAIMSAEQHEYALQQLEIEKQHKERGVYNRYAAYIGFAILALTSAIPIAAAYLTPALIAPTVIAVVTPLSLSLGITALTAVLSDKIVGYYSNETIDLGITKSLANFFGAEKKCKEISKDINVLLEDKQTSYKKMLTDISKMSEVEKKIKEVTHSRHQTTDAKSYANEIKKKKIANLSQVVHAK